MTILDEAKALVYGDREANYGHPVKDFTRIGRGWAAILDLPEIPPEKVALMMGWLKMSRLIGNPGHRDSNVDWAGYAATFERVIEKAGNGHATSSHPGFCVRCNGAIGLAPARLEGGGYVHIPCSVAAAQGGNGGTSDFPIAAI